MKKIIFSAVFIFFTSHVFAQKDSVKLFPPINLLLPDSATHFTKKELAKKTPVLLMLFNPACDHCRHETEELLKNIDKFRDIQIVMATSMLFDSMMTFRERYKLAEQPNIIVGQDTHYFLPGYFHIRNLPFLAFYNKKKELISSHEGSLPIPAILEIFKDAL